MTYGKMQMSEGVKTGGGMFDTLPSLEVYVARGQDNGVIRRVCRKMKFERPRPFSLSSWSSIRDVQTQRLSRHILEARDKDSPRLDTTKTRGSKKF